MQFEIVSTEEKLKKHLKKDNRNLNIFCLLVYTLAVVICCFQLFEQPNFWKSFLVIYFIGLVILAILLWLITYFSTLIRMLLLKKVTDYQFGKFTEIINEEGITEILNETAVDLKWEEVAKVIHAYNFIIIKPKKRGESSFIYRRDNFDTKEEYEAVVKLIEKYYAQYKKKEEQK